MNILVHCYVFWWQNRDAVLPVNSKTNFEHDPRIDSYSFACQFLNFLLKFSVTAHLGCVAVGHDGSQLSDNGFNG